MPKEMFKILDRWNGEVKFTAEIECSPDALPSIKLGHDASRPAERWFMMIRPGDVPGATGEDGKETGGGYAARIALEWAEQYCASRDIPTDKALPEPVAP